MKTEKQLRERFNQIKSEEHILTSGGPHAVGDHLEVLFGKTIDNDRGCDFKELELEMKTSFSSKTPVSLMGAKPDDASVTKDLAPKLSVKENGNFSTTIRHGKINRNTGLTLDTMDNKLVLKKGDQVHCSWDYGELMKKIQNKMPSLLYIDAWRESQKKGAKVRYNSMTIYRNIKPEAFKQLIQEGKIQVDFRVYRDKKTGMMKNKGTSFRLTKKADLPRLFESVDKAGENQ